MGQHATCTRCSFNFWGGHSHDTGESSCACLACGSTFSCPTSNRWGPEIGEEIPLIRVVKRKGKKKKPRRIPTGVSFVAERGEAYQVGDRTSYFVHYPIETIPCPECHQARLACGFDAGDACPKCKVGKILVHFVEY